MKIVVSIIMGFFTAIIFCILVGMLFLTENTESGSFVLVSFLLAWVLLSYLIARNSKSISKVFSRGFLIGAAEWLAMIPASLILAGRAVPETVSSSGVSNSAVETGATIGGLFAFFTGSFISIVMAGICLLGFAISHFLGREMKPETGKLTRKCPECAELIQQEAKKCRYCGATLS